MEENVYFTKVTYNEDIHMSQVLNYFNVKLQTDMNSADSTALYTR
jgi:hypothetical protein